MDLNIYGWNPLWEQKFARLRQEDWLAARVIRQDRKFYQVVSSEGILTANCSGRMQHQTKTLADWPAVGDWVAGEMRADGFRIQSVLPRSSRFSRKMAGERSDEQLVAANIDRLFLVCGLDQDFNLRRIERFLAAARQNQVEVAIVLNKTDSCPCWAERKLEVEAISADTPVLAISGLHGQGLEQLSPFLKPAQTFALVGSSGAGKSTLLNTISGKAVQTTRATREGDGRGRHTTTARQLFAIPGGALLIDTPGIRELGIRDEGQDLETVFDAIQQLALQCRFRNCTHTKEPGCAVQTALQSGTLDIAHFHSWLRLSHEKQQSARKNWT